MIERFGSMGILAFVLVWLTGRQTKSLDANTAATSKAEAAITSLDSTIKGVCKFDPKQHICQGGAK